MSHSILEEFTTNFPKKTNILCYHCIHKFNTEPLPLPFLIEKNKFYVKYVFCSWECMKTYVLESNISNKNFIYSLIQQFYKTIVGHTNKIDFAPPRITLKDFGGPLSINEFRKSTNNTTYNIIEYPIIVSNPKVDKKDNFSWIKEESAKTTFNKSKSESDNLNLQRPKSSNKKNALADAMGLLRV